MSRSSHPPVRMAMVGGGPGAFIGPVHRMAAELDARIQLVAGAFSRDTEKCRAAAALWDVAPDRAYADYRDMMRAEAARPDGAQLVAIVTPNHLHLPVAQAALEAGLHVISDKPATATLDEALELRRVVEGSGRLFGLTYTYTGYPMVREAREIVRRGDLGRIRKVVVEYSQGWLSEPIEQAGDNKQAGWRTDPTESGAGGCSGDIGVHAFNIAEFVSGLQVERVCADLSTVVPGRALDDDCNVLLRFQGDVPGVLVASQIAAGDRNGLRLRVYGEKGGLDWSHESPNTLTLNWLSAPTQTLHAGSGYLSDAAVAATRLPTGHPEGFIEAFGNIYRDFAEAIATGTRPDTVPGILAGVRGMAFIDRAILSSREGSTWVSLQEFAA
ncbi:Gfo/Idh/MocA family protein [Phenylobacterium deserti]|uniref:Gfo/Idh/MocA family oxidoreductase n=1 Tax=Phenylobacterium deserti TaxID=1914756 RepID=A0A328A842_9CAUL|nr:Gfo/Idh/MocA family oxidoreductase [Phenylobacterium deserti]RAK50753.1 gfo/Idh/MocA family oxidoreductase [Phenylobacterium deserti]